jgi:methyl-accepting chemotaxis protein
MKIGARLYLGFGVVLVLLVALWGVGKWGVASLQGSVSKTFRGDVQVMEHSTRARSNTLGLRRFEKDVFINLHSAKDVEKYYKSWLDERDKLNARLGDLDKVAVLPEDRQIVKALRENQEKYAASFIKAYQKIQAGEIKSTQEANQAMAEAKQATHKMLEDVQVLSRAALQRVGKAEDSLAAFADSISRISLVIAVAAMLVGVIVAWRTARSISAPLNELRKTIAEVEKNSDFTRRIPVRGQDEVGQTAQSFNELLTAMQQALGQVRDSVAKVSDSAQNLSSASSQVAAGSAQQSEATSSMAAAVEQMTVSINHVTDSAREALDISHQSGRLSSEGGEIIGRAAGEMAQIAEVVRNTAHAIEELGQQSRQISSIVQVIKDVADQTNLLALNAAIEAARAGEQGRGFAVVADEVRKLAERTTKATDEITQMIAAIQGSAETAIFTMEAAVDQVSGGAALANQAGSSIVQIKGGAEQVVHVVNDISSALSEQSSASNEIAAQVERVAQMTEENSAAAAATAGAANDLHELAGVMQAAVSRFKII